MGFHTFDPERADRLEDPTRLAYLSVDELLALVEPDPGDRIADLGSGTGFYTSEVAPSVATVYAVDVQPAMHARYREQGVPENVELVSADAGHLPFADGSLDGVVSTMTYHEFANAEALAELRRVLRPGGRLGVGDWTATGEGERGPPRSERFAAADARDQLEAAGFDVRCAVDRRETFVASAAVQEAR